MRVSRATVQKLRVPPVCSSPNSFMERGKEERHRASRERSWLLTWVGPVRKGGEGRGGEERGERGETVYMHIQCMKVHV